MSGYQDGFWQGSDGLRLHFRDYPGFPQGPPLLCLPGLTRNARDFEALATYFSSPAGGGWRVITAEMRGRGASSYAPDPASYTARRYVADVEALLDQLGIARCVVIGTSLGGLMAMMLALAAPQRLAGVVLNDIGPSVEVEGLVHIQSYLGLDERFADLDAVAAALRASFGAAFPDRDAAGWRRFAGQLTTRDETGALRFDYDPRIAVPFGQPEAALPDLWPAIDVLATLPLLVIRGELSDILSEATLAAMVKRAPGCEVLRLARVGHVPTLDEPEARAAIARLLALVA